MQEQRNYKIDTSQDLNLINDDLHHYDYVYLNHSGHPLVSLLGIKVYENDKLLHSVAVGSDSGGTGIGKNSIVYELDRLLICCSDEIYCLSIPNLKLLWSTKTGSTCFEILKWEDFYIIHGELEISKLDNEGKIIWNLGVGEIFVTPNGENNLQLEKTHFIAKDWNNQIYKFDYDGNKFENLNPNEIIEIDISNGYIKIDNKHLIKSIPKNELEEKHNSHNISGLRIGKYLFNITKNFNYGQLKSLTIYLNSSWIKENYHSYCNNQVSDVNEYVDFCRQHTNLLLDMLLKTNKRNFSWGNIIVLVDPRDPTVFAEIKYYRN